MNVNMRMSVALSVFVLIFAGSAQGAGSLPLTVAHSQNTDTVPTYEVFEITLRPDREYAHPFLGVTIRATFNSPGGEKVRVGGFYYGENRWKVRFAPSREGEWSYAYLFSTTGGARAGGQGSFRCVRGRNPRHGFVRQDRSNPFRWVLDDGTPYFPIGLQDCWADHSETGSVLDTASMEGPFRTDRTDLVELPEGPLYVRGPSMNPQNADVYFRRFARCGFNLYRFSQSNCSYALYSDLDHYLVPQGIMTDRLLQRARRYDFRVFYGLFGFQKAFNHSPENTQNMAKVKRFVKYSVDRWGAYVDFWELFNEQKADDGWYEIVIPYLRSIDPYNHPITTSWQRPELPGIDVNAPHWYQREEELKSDAVTAARAKRWKEHGKPVIVGEQGNRVGRNKPQPPGVGGVWDAGSARRMRIRCWTALFHEMSFIFWNTSYARDGHFMNIWLGPKEREYIGALQDFAYMLDADVKMSSPAVSAPDRVRAHGLASDDRVAAYLHHFDSHAEPVRDVKVTVDVPGAATGYWYSPRTAAILDVFQAPAGRRTFEAPEFTVDLALLITPQGAPDIDGDGVANHLDDDDDNDGVPDRQDAFPLEPEEWADEDHDWIGDNLDADDDGDGRGDDQNQNGIPDHEEMDLDGDNVPRSKAIPWDAFPLDPHEWRDTDGDGIGDNADEDDDDDGWSDAEEKQAGTDPLDELNFPRVD